MHPITMDLEEKFKALRDCMDEWVKLFNKRLLDNEVLPEKMEELHDTIEHDFTKIKDLEAAMGAVRRELQGLRIAQVMLQNFVQQQYTPRRCPDKVEPGEMPSWQRDE